MIYLILMVVVIGLVTGRQGISLRVVDKRVISIAPWKLLKEDRNKIR